MVLNIPWIAIFWSASNVSSFLVSEDGKARTTTEAPREVEAPKAYKHRSGEINLSKSLETLRETAISTNPLLLLFGFPGIFLLRRGTRLLFGSVALWLLVLGTFMVPLKPQLEFDRMLVILSLLLCVPTAVVIGRLFESGTASGYAAFLIALPALVGGFLLTGPLVTGALLLNRTPHQHAFSEPIVQNMVDAIQQQHRNGRVLFSGFVLHELSRGHLAPLAYFTSRPLIASGEVHRHWRYTQVFPKPFIARGDEGIAEYLDLYNVTAVFAHEREWREYFYERPESYRVVWKQGLFHLFERTRYVSNYFLEGSGEILGQSSNTVSLRLGSPRAVLKFNYFPFLRSSQCEVRGFPAATGVTFVELTDCPVGETIELASTNPVSRLLH